MRRYLILIAVLLVPLIPIGLLALGVIKRPVNTPKTVELTVWTSHDDIKAYETLVKSYNQVRPYIKITIEQVTPDNYTSRLKDAWARGKGPDVFELPASSIGEFADDFVLPIPPTTKVFTYVPRKVFFRKEVEIQQTTIPSITVAQLSKDFADVVSDDVVRNDNIYGLPLSLDTLVLYYNRDILRSGNIVEPPKTWGQLAGMVPKLTIADEQGKILQSAIPLGTAANVAHAADIISLLFLQDGVTMNGPDGSVLLDQSLSSEGTNLGVNALTFYTSFSNPNKQSYSWNADQPNSREAFIRGKTALYIGYGSDQHEIETKTSINFGVAPIPHLQTDGKDALLTPAGNALQVNYGNYSVLSVFQRTNNPHEAWNFVQFITKQPQYAALYLNATKRVGALRSMLAQQQEDPSQSVFAEQAISARSWYHGRNATAVTQYLHDMINSVAQGAAQPLEALALARKQIELTTMRQR